MKLVLATALAACAAAVAGAGDATAAATPDTTRPGVVYRVNVVIFDNRMTISHATYVRGAIIRYHVTNKGSKPYGWVVQGVPLPKALRPGQTSKILINWWRRGKFVAASTSRGKLVVKRIITIN
jgi:hypothetical protein